MFLKKGYVLHNRYEIIDKIGAGGMSIVYKAEDLHLKRKVAIKVLRDEFVEDEEFIKRFRREAESVALLNHPNIVNVYDSSVDGDINFIVMEFLNGQNLEEIISKVGKIDVNAALTILYNISEALSYAHKNGIIHRDLKTKNVVINEEGIVKVADFGIAQATSSSTISVATNAIGSVYYYSPEMAKGETCDARSDIYSLGMLGYELLTGKHAFDGDTPVQVALKQVADITPKPSDICGCSLSVDYLIAKATEKNPKDRYQNAYELMRDIDAILDGKDITKKAPQVERDEVSNFAKILDDYNEIRASEERKEHIELAKKEQQKSLDELHKLNVSDPSDEISAMEEGITFKYMNEAERRDIERKEKIDKILNKFKLKKEEKYEDYVAKEDEPENGKIEEDPRKRPGYISLTDVDENFYADKDESYHNEYESSKIAKKESSSKSAQELAAAELFDNYDVDDKKKTFEKDINDKVSKPEKKKKSFKDFFTIDVDEEDDFEDEKDLKLEEDKMAKSRDEYGYISKDDDKQVVKAAIWTSLIIIFFILIGMIKYMMYLYDNRLVEVPELVGEVYEEIADDYKKKGIQIEVIGEEVNMRYAKGVIISQENDPGSKMNRRNVIGVVLSKGKSGSVMPDLISRTVEEAKDALEKYGVSISVAEEASNDVVEGYIARTEPAADEPVRQGMTVVLYLSTGGDGMYVVPDLTGMTEKEAKEALEKAGLKLGNVVYRDGSNESNGVVTSQTELAKTKLDEDAEVGIGLDVKKDDEKPNDNQKPDDTQKPAEDTKPQTQTNNDDVLVSAKVVSQSWMVDGQSYIVEIRIDDKPEYRQKINKEDFPITQKFNAKRGQVLTVYIDGKYITDKICE